MSTVKLRERSGWFTRAGKTVILSRKGKLKGVLCMVKKGAWVIIEKTLLESDQRAKGIPEDTSLVPLKMWVCGELASDASIGDIVEIRTKTNRPEQGLLREANPTTSVTYGDFVPEVLQIGKEAREFLFGGGADE